MQQLEQIKAVELLSKNDEHSDLLTDQLNKLEKDSGGLCEYLNRARQLFEMLSQGKSPYEGY